MAKLIGKKAPGDGGNSAATEELEILHPERVLRFGDSTIVVREYGGVEWLRLLPFAAALIDGLADLLQAGSVPTYESALALIAENVDLVMPLVAQAADMSVEEIDALKPDQMDQLLMAWWGANGRFFVGRAVSRVAVARHEARLMSAGASSTQPSYETATQDPTSGK